MIDPAEVRAEGRRLLAKFRALEADEIDVTMWLFDNADVLLADSAPEPQLIKDEVAVVKKVLDRLTAP